PGLSRAFSASIPLAERFGEELERFGTTLSDFLVDMAQAAPGAKIALHDLFSVLDSGFDMLGGGIEILSKTYEVGRKFGMLPPPEFLFNAGPIIGTWQLLNPELEKSVNNLKDMATPTEELARAHEDAGDAAKKQADALEKLNRQVDDYYAAILGPLDAEERWHRALLDTNDALKENGRTLDIHTRAGLANRDAIEELFQAAKNRLDQGTITEEQYRKEIQSLGTLEQKFRDTTGFVDDLVTAYSKVPSEIRSTLSITASGSGLSILLRLLRGTVTGSIPLTMGEHSGGQVGMLVGSTAGRPGPGHGAFLDLPTRDSGGPVAPGKSYLIGRPEILTMGSMGGHVTPLGGGGFTAAPVNVYGGGFGQMAFEWLRNEIAARGGTLAVLNLRAS
ncbi:MAG: hypothetical protein ACM30G_01180, partial [Micromonosporaceae bacterium]